MTPHSLPPAEHKLTSDASPRCHRSAAELVPSPVVAKASLSPIRKELLYESHSLLILFRMTSTWTFCRWACDGGATNTGHVKVVRTWRDTLFNGTLLCPALVNKTKTTGFVYTNAYKQTKTSTHTHTPPSPQNAHRAIAYDTSTLTVLSPLLSVTSTYPTSITFTAALLHIAFLRLLLEVLQGFSPSRTCHKYCFSPMVRNSLAFSDPTPEMQRQRRWTVRVEENNSNKSRGSPDLVDIA